MSRLPRITGKEIVSALSRYGFHLIHVRGSHHYMQAADSQKLITIPVHTGKTVKPGTLKSILEQAGLSVDEFIDLL